MRIVYICLALVFYSTTISVCAFSAPLPPPSSSALKFSFFNKGLASNKEERAELQGFLPPAYISMEQQVANAFAELRSKPTPIDKYIYLETIKGTSQPLYYALLTSAPEELLPIVYTPTVGEACIKYSEIYDGKPKGLWITLEDKGKVKEVLSKWPSKDIKVVVFTDGERILGLGDLGANGMGIPVGKIALYIACGGIPPENALPVTLDVGTENQGNLDNPNYIGLKRHRARGEEYDALVDEFMTAAQDLYGPQVCLQFEDFANANAFRLLHKYEDKCCCFNDDIQGTASVVLGGLFASVRLTGKPLGDNVFLFFGAGSAAIGIADLIAYAIQRESGTPLEEARKKIWLVDSKGLLVESRIAAGTVNEEKERYCHPGHEEMKGLLEIVNSIRPSGLIGVSTIPNTFTPEVLKAMASINEIPIIFPLSNPTSKSECTAEAAYTHTEGRCIFASGSPFDPVVMDGKTYYPGQANNCFVFPGIGLGVIASEIERVTIDEMYVAAKAVGEQVSVDRLKSGCVYPFIRDIRDVSAHVAAKICENAAETGRLRAAPQADFLAYCQSLMYKPLGQQA